MIKLIDTNGVNTIVSTDNIRYIDVKPNEDKTCLILFNYIDSTEVSLTIDSETEQKFYDQLDEEMNKINNFIELKTTNGREYLVCLKNIKYVYFGAIIDEKDSLLNGTRTVKIYREDGSVDEINGITLDKCKELKNKISRLR